MLKSLLYISCVLLSISIDWSYGCPTGCICIQKQVDCRPGFVSSIPRSISNSTSVLKLSKNTFANPVLTKQNFSGFTELTELWMKECGIKSIQSDTFSEMPSLTLLDLSFNHLKTISPSALSGLHLQYLFLGDNPGLILPNSGFQDMTTEVIDIKNCGLTDISPGVFSPTLDVLRKLFLSGNNIKVFTPGMLGIFAKLENIRIQENPLICDCGARWLKDFYDQNKDKFTDNGSVHEPRCGAPLAVAGEFFNRIDASNFLCEKPTLDAKMSFTSEKGTIQCVSRGHPTPKVVLRRPNGMLQISNAQQNQDQTVVNHDIFTTDKDVHGEYRCVASNEAGNVTLSVNMTWPFNTSMNCEKTTTGKEVLLTNNKPDDISSDAQPEKETDLFKVKYFTLVDLISAVFGTFVGTLIVCVVILHFCVYKKKRTLSQYSTPPMSEYSGSSIKNGVYPTQQHLSLHNTSTPNIQSRPLPTKPYPNMYDENHYMSTPLEERDDFINFGQHNHALSSAQSPPCEACTRTMASHIHQSTA